MIRALLLGLLIGPLLGLPAAPASAAVPAVDSAVDSAADSAVSVSSTPKARECTLRGEFNTWVSGRAVPCSSKHTGLTLWVSTWPSTTSPSAADKLTPGSPQRRRFSQEMATAAETCRSKVVAYIGAGRQGFSLSSRLTEDVTGPNAEQWKRGERWLRCDVVLPMRDTASRATLQDLRPMGSFRGLYTDLRNVLELPAASRGAWTCMVKGEWRDYVSCATPRRGLLIALLEFSGRDVGWRGSVEATADAASKVCALFLSRTGTPNARNYVVTTDRAISQGTLDTTVFTCLIPHGG